MAPEPNIKTGINKGRIIIGIIKPCHLIDNVKLAPIQPIKLNAGVPTNSVTSMGKIISSLRLIKIPKRGVKIIIGKQMENQ